MSTKRLSKTVIEGGRYGYNKWERRHSHNEVRADERDYLKQVANDPDLADDIDIEDIRPVYKGFTDKLAPMYRWLDSQVGRSWSEVRSEVFTKFDTRTTAGRHITFDHLLRDVVETLSGFDSRGNIADPAIPKEPNPNKRYSYSYHDYYVDQNGILCKKVRESHNYKIPFFDTKAIANWLNGRVVGKVGKKLFWFEPTDTWNGYSYQWTTKWNQRYGHLLYYFLHYEIVHERDTEGHLVMDENGKYKVKEYKPVWKLGQPNFRQYRKLNDKEMQFWNSMPEYYQDRVLERSPTSPKKPKFDYYNYYRYAEYHD